MLSEIELVAREHGYELALADVPTIDDDQIGVALRTLGGRRVAGLVVLSPIELPWSLLESVAIAPVVLMDATASSTAPFTTIDQEAGARMTIEHLASLGHRRFLLVGGPPRWNDAALRLRGWRAAIEQIGGEVVRVTDGDWSPASGHAAVVEAQDAGIRFGNEVTAVVCANDATAVGVLHGLRSAGISVPEAVSVTGFDDLDIAAYLEPPLTTVHQDFRALARKAIEQLLAHIQTPGEADVEQVVEPELVIRHSTAPPHRT